MISKEHDTAELSSNCTVVVCCISFIAGIMEMREELNFEQEHSAELLRQGPNSEGIK